MFRSEIVTKSNGIILRVRTVVKSLLAGSRNQENISDLQRKLQYFPSDINDLYTHMLGRIDPLYAEQASRVFQIYQSTRRIMPDIYVLGLENTVTATYIRAMASQQDWVSTMKSTYSASEW